jgi:hypothetical protein
MLQILGLVLSCLLALTAGAQTALVPQATQGRISLEEWQPSETTVGSSQLKIFPGLISCDFT